ncbi:MAG: DUF805 domain-containing protein [Gemmobacter sp.]|uniref:DUF805 domain-containing protein n=1 Tax=Gemmobacter sp. TaxID=1898957 RepID=UPI001A593752|nr:DUF805 domain-containing protein [Gemmobacter sp.]MBL8562934.1 DUF805 domain-containing protein [Gemmobacter sp.]
MEFGQAVRKCMIEKYYPLIEGRAARSEFWWFMLFYILVIVGFMIVLGLLAALVMIPLSLNGGTTDAAVLASFVPLALLFMVMPLLYFMVPPAVAVTIRRLHDRNISGWWYLGFTVASMIPGVNLLVMLAMFILMLLPGTQGDNRFGGDPRAPQGNIFS